MTVYAFGIFELDDESRELCRQGTVVDLQPKAFDLLVHLVRNRERVLGKDELLRAVWSDVAVSESSLSFGIKLVRKALEDGEQSLVRTIHGRGFRFIAECSRREPRRERSAAPATDLSFLTRGAPLVGRGAEQATLVRLLEEAMQGKARVAVVSGDAGIGKTRLSGELACVAAARGARVLVGACDENAPPAFWPWLPVVRRLAAVLPGDVLARLEPHDEAELARLVPGLFPATLPGASPVRTGQRLQGALARLLALAARQGPLVLVLDDVQWADAASLRALELLVQLAEDLPLLAVVVYREGESGEDHPLTACLQALEAGASCTRLRLEGLSASEAAQLLAHLPDAPADAVATEAIARMTEGNPFFVEELVRHLAEEHEAASAETVFRSGAEVVGVRDIVERRLSRLTPPCTQLLNVAAVAGREFSFDVACAAIDFGHDDGDACIDEAIAARILEQSPADPATFRFRHALIREVLYRRIAAVRRGELHRQVGDAIEQVVASREEGRAEQLAHHFSQPGASPDKALVYAAEAGERALARLAHADAAQRFEQVAAILARAFPKRLEALHEAWMRAGDAWQLGGNGQRSRAAYHRGAELARAIGDSRRFLLAATADRSRRPFSGFELLALHEEAAAVADAAGNGVPDAIVARALSRLAASLYNVPGTAERREELAQRSLTLTQDAADATSRLVVLDNVSMALWRPEHVERRLSMAREQEGLAARDADDGARLAAMVWEISALLESGRIRDAVDAIERFVPVARAARLPAYLADVTMFEAMRAFLDCRFDHAEALVLEAMSRGHESDEVAPSIRFGALMMAMRGEQGREAEILPMLHVLEEQMPDLPWAYSFADLYARSGDLERAGAYFERVARDDFAALRAMEGHSLWLPSVFIVARACGALGRAPEAAWLHARALPYARHWAVIGQGTVCLGSIEHALGVLAMTSGRTAQGVAHLETALRRHEEEGTVLPALRSMVELARALGQGDARQRRRAQTLAAKTEKIARAAGHEFLAREAASLAEALAHAAAR